jgi:hypothetical protein
MWSEYNCGDISTSVHAGATELSSVMFGKRTCPFASVVKRIRDATRRTGCGGRQCGEATKRDQRNEEERGTNSNTHDAVLFQGSKILKERDPSSRARINLERDIKEYVARRTRSASTK